MSGNIKANELERIGTVSHRDSRRNPPTSASHFFHENPDLFRISPRPGGFLRLLVPSRSQDFMTDCIRNCPKESCLTVSNNPVSHPYRPLSNNSSTSSVTSIRNRHSFKCICGNIPLTSSEEASDIESESLCTRIFPIKTNFETTCDCSDDVSSYPPDLSPCFGLNPSQVLQKSMEMLAVTISCVMQMAAKLDVPSETLLCAETYLQCMKDEHGKYPRNVAGLLGEIRKLSSCTNRRSYKERDERGSRSSIGSSIFSNSTIPEPYYHTPEKFPKRVYFSDQS